MDLLKFMAVLENHEKSWISRLKTIAKKLMFDAKFEEFKQKMNVKTNTECLTKLMECYESKGTEQFK